MIKANLTKVKDAKLKGLPNKKDDSQLPEVDLYV